MKLVFLRGAARRAMLVVALGGALASDSAKAETVEPVGRAAQMFCVSIHASLFDSKTAARLKKPSGVVVWLVPAAPVTTTTTDQPAHYRVVQQGKSFLPHLLVIPVGSTVEFRNYDHWDHNAFSSFGSTRFDLGTERPGTRKELRFDRAGVLHVFCTMHPQMEAVIVTVDTPYFGVSDRAGRVNIHDVPAGTYFVRAWSEGVSSHAFYALHRTIVVGQRPGRVPQVSIAMIRQAPIRGVREKSGRPGHSRLDRPSMMCRNLRAAPQSRTRPESSSPDPSRPTAAPATSVGFRDESQLCTGQ